MPWICTEMPARNTNSSSNLSGQLSEASGIVAASHARHHFRYAAGSRVHELKPGRRGLCCCLSGRPSQPHHSKFSADKGDFNVPWMDVSTTRRSLSWIPRTKPFWLFVVKPRLLGNCEVRPRAGPQTHNHKACPLRARAHITNFRFYDTARVLSRANEVVALNTFLSRLLHAQSAKSDRNMANTTREKGLSGAGQGPFLTSRQPRERPALTEAFLGELNS